LEDLGTETAPTPRGSACIILQKRYGVTETGNSPYYLGEVGRHHVCAVYGRRGLQPILLRGLTKSGCHTFTHFAGSPVSGRGLIGAELD